MHIQHPPVVAWLAESERADGDMGRNLHSVVVGSFDLADVPVTAGQKQFPPVFTDHQRGKAVPVEPHRPEGFGDRFVQPVGIRTSGGSEVDVKRPVFLVITQGNRGARCADVPEFIGNYVRSHGGQIRAIGVDRIKPVFREEHDGSVRLHPGFRTDDAHFFGNTLKRASRGRIALHHPDASGSEAEQVVIKTGNHRQGPWTHICS